MSFRICISDPKSRKTYQVEKEAISLIGVKIGQQFDGGMIGLDGFTMKLTGGSDKEGFPMRPEMDGTHRKKLLLTGGSGFNPKKKGLRRRKFVRGNQVSEEIMQVNCKAVSGEGDIEMMLGLKKEEPKEGEASEAKPEEKKEAPAK
jgi:small subunit ribosomal protein S6e